MTKKRLKIGVKLALCSSVLLTGIVSCGQSNENDNSDYYSLKLNYNDDKSRPLVLDVQKGQSVQTPTDPIRTGYSFAGWFTEEVGGSEITFPYLLTKDDVIYAHWEAAKYNVSFDLNYENATLPYTSSVDYLSSVDALENNPTRDGFVFRYWSTTPDGTNPVTFPYTIKKDTTFYASWRDADVLVHNVTVVYGDYDGAPTSFTLEIEDGKQVTSSLLPSATRSGFGFDGWSLSQDGSQKVTLPYTPTGSCTLYAIWKAQAYKLSLRYNYVDAPEIFYDQISFGAGDSIDEPTAPTRAGYQFEGWYTTALGGTKIVFPVSLKKSTVYFAHWKSNPVVTDVFDAEYVEFEPNTKYPGYSGEATGNGVIIPNDVSGVRVDNYPVNSARTSGKGYYVSFQYMLGAQIIYNIEASEDLNNVKLYANWAVEIADGGLTFGPTGPNAYEVSVNGSPINYTPAVVGGPNEGAGQYKSGFKEYLLASNISLRKGTNTIILEPKNENGAVMGGTIKAVAPMTDYIRFDYGSTGKLSWSPVYDNLDGK